jgi:hypothetical protein
MLIKNYVGNSHDKNEENIESIVAKGSLKQSSNLK